MRAFDIYDASKRGRRARARLLFDERKDKMTIVIADDASPGDLPLMLSLYAERGQRKVPDKWARRWVAERIPPQGRQNLGEILRAHGLDHYDEIALLAASEGRSAQDDFLIREVVAGEQRVAYATVAVDGGKSDAGKAPSPLSAAVGAQLAAKRREAGMTQQQLAEKTGIDQAAISRIESGRGNPTLDTLQALAEGVGADVAVEIGCF